MRQWWCDANVFVPSEDFLLNAVAFGDPSHPVFLAHGGWVGSWELWQEPFQLMQQDWRCISYDHRGAGATTASPAQVSPQGLVDDVMRVLDFFGVDSCVLAGESLGAVTAMSTALQHPDRIRGLVLVDGLASAGTTAPHPMIAGCRTDYGATVQWFIDACMPEPDSEHLRRWGRQILLRAEPEAAARMFESYDEQPATPRATLINQPTLILHGELDVIVPPAGAHALAAVIPNADLVLIPDAGHVPTITRPQAVVDAVNEWWGTRHPSQTSPSTLES